MANKKKKPAKRPPSRQQETEQGAPQQGSERMWRIIGRDALDWGFYPLPGTYPSKKEAERAARERLRYLEVHQPTKTSGGQKGIQDRVYVIRPEGDSYRLIK